MSWSPFYTLRRLIGHSLFDQVGPETSNQRNVFVREFNTTKSNSEKFDSIAKIATAHANALTGENSTNEVDIRSSADNFAIALWGETLYANPNYHVGGRVLNLSESIITLVGNPWPSVWNLSVMTGGGLSGPLSKFAFELANLNLFGSLSRILKGT